MKFINFLGANPNIQNGNEELFPMVAIDHQSIERKNICKFA
jgi:hypothetical protein